METLASRAVQGLQLKSANAGFGNCRDQAKHAISEHLLLLTSVGPCDVQHSMFLSNAVN